MRREHCVFCEIVKGKSKSWTVYEEELVKAFLDTNPISDGHTLVVSKGHYGSIYDIPEETLGRIVVAAKRLADAYVKVFDVKAVSILHASGKEAQQSVSHFHVHFVPRREGDGLDLWLRPHIKVDADFDRTLQKIGKRISSRTPE